MARVYNEKIFKALEEEYDTDTRISQLQSLKEIIDEAGSGLFSAEEVNHLGLKMVEHVDRSNQRIKDNKDYSKQEAEDEDDELDAEDLALLKAENSNEYDLQTSAAEIIGTLFKTHKDFVANVVNECKTKVIPQALSSGEVKRFRFSLFILDDMVEHLGPTYFSPEDWFTIVTTICQYCDHTSAGLRQASVYGIGIIAQNSGEAFGSNGQLCLESLKKAIDVPITEKV